MGLLNGSSRAQLGEMSLEGILNNLHPPYELQGFLLVILNQIAQWIPAEGYYAYTADPDEHQLTLRVTRTPTGIAAVGPNYAGLVLGGTLHSVPLEISPLSDPWGVQLIDGVLQLGFGPRTVFRLSVGEKFRFREGDRNKVQAWLKQVEPVLNLIFFASKRPTSDEPRLIPDVRRSRQDLLWQIPHLVGLLSGLGSDVLKSADGYLATWDDALSVDMLWNIGQGRQLAERVRPETLYRSARSYRFAVWENQELPEPFLDMGFRTLIAIPLNAADGAAGVLCLSTVDVVRRSESLMQTLRYLAESLENSLLSRGAAATMAKNYLNALFTAATLLDEADPYNKNHHRQVAQLSARLAMKAKWPENRVRHVEMAGRLHDIGMVTVALDLTSQGGNLAEQARQTIQQHPAVGAELLEGLPESVLPQIVVRAVREHHERWDGLGYPDGLKGEQLCEEGRLVACAEQFVARISHRSYRQGLTVERALYDVQQLSGRQIDPQVIQLLIDLYQDAGIRPQTPT